MNRTEHLWIIHQGAITPQESGGTRHYSLAKFLGQHGYTVTIVCQAGYFSHKRQKHMSLEVVNGVQFIRIPGCMDKRSHLRRLLGMLGFSWRILTTKIPAHSPTIILGSSPSLFAAAAARLLAWRCSVPFVLEVRDLWPESLIELGRISRYHPLVIVMRVLERWLYRSCDGIVTLLSKSVSYFSKHGVPEDHIYWIPNGIDAQTLGPHSPLPLPRDTFNIYYMGALGIPNGLDILLDAATILNTTAPHIHWYFIGDGVQKTFLKTKAKVSDLHQVHFIEAVPKNAVMQILADADACVLSIPSSPLYQWGVSPNKLYDYLYAGRPLLLVGSDTLDFKLSEAGIVPCEPNARSVAEAAVSLSRRSLKERQAMGELNRQIVMRDYEMEQISHKLASALKKISTQFSA